MDFMELSPRKKPRSILSHILILSSFVLTLILFRLADDEVTGKAEISDALGFTAIFVVVSYYLGWLPEIWARTNRTPAEPFVMPVFIFMILAYLYLGFRSYFIQPGVTGLAVGLQLFVMVCLSCRIG